MQKPRACGPGDEISDKSDLSGKEEIRESKKR